MAIARKADEIDTHAYWSDVKSALVEVCGLSLDDAAAEVGEIRLAMSCLSDWGRLLAYHDSVPQAAEDIWKQRCGDRIGENEVEGVREKLIDWYAARSRRRGFPYAEPHSSAK